MYPLFIHGQGSESLILFWTFAMLVVAAAHIAIKKHRHSKRFGVRYLYRERQKLGDFHTLVPRLRRDPEMHFTYFRMTAERFDKLLQIISHDLHKSSFNTPLSPAERLCITLWYLSTGFTMTALTFEYHVSKRTVSTTIREVCRALWHRLQPAYMPIPNSVSWRNNAENMYKLWDTPNFVGALDGKHVRIRCPPKSGSEFFNYKKYFSIVLLASCNAQRIFTTVDVGCQGRICDGGVFNSSALGKCLHKGTLGLPEPRGIDGTGYKIPYYFVADDAFPLLINIMRPYPGSGLSLDKRIYNYRITRARILIENAFGILVAQWGIFHTPIYAHLNLIKDIVKVACILHNFIMVEDCSIPGHARMYCPTGFVDREEYGTITKDEWRSFVSPKLMLQSVGRLGSNNYTRAANDVRNILTQYFTSDVGSLPWQVQHVYRGQ